MVEKESSRYVKVTVPRGMYDEIKKAISRRLYRDFADFFYVAGQKELDRIREIIYD